jgi:general secretion pathway protein A
MYNSYFGFSETPFAITPDPRFLYMSPRHQDALAHLQYGLYESNGFVLLTGEVGTGKTALCRYLLANLPDEIDAALILNPRQTALELVANICDELHIDYPHDTSSIKTLIDRLNKKLLESHTQGRRTVLIIDEAQNLSHEVLEQVRLLTNLETSKHKLLQILLIGQPELQEILARPELRQLTQRITARYHIQPLTLAETTAYIHHRIAIAGVKRPLFTKSAIRAIHRESKGIPRLVNLICDRALLGAYAQTKAIINTGVGIAAAKEVLPQIHPGRPSRIGPATLGMLLVFVGLLLYGLQYQPELKYIDQLTAGPADTRPSLPPLSEEAAHTLVETAPPADQTEVPATAQAIASETEEPTNSNTPDSPDEAQPPLQDQVQLDHFLANASCDSKTSLNALLQKWGVEYPATSSLSPCETAEAAGLRCMHNKGTWNNLRRYNRPSVLEMQDSNGKWHHILLGGITDNTVSLSCGENDIQIPIAQADKYWLGEYLLLWQPPGTRSQLSLGDRGPDVAKIQKQLMALNNDIPAENLIVSSTYNTTFKEQIKSFQEKHALTPDGIAGKDTLILLNTLEGAPSIPMLQQGQLIEGK